MQWSMQFIPTVMFSLVQVARFNNVNAEDLTTVNSFSKDWKIDANDSLVYTRSFNRHHEFGYIHCDNVKKYCHVEVIHAETTDYRERTCSLRQDLINGNTGKMSLYFADNGYNDSQQVVQSWWLVNEFDREHRLTSLDLRSCLTTRYNFQPVEGDPNSTHVIPYGYLNFVLVYRDANANRCLKLVSIMGEGQNQPPWNLDLGYEHMLAEKAIEVGSSVGLFYLGTDGESGGKLSVMYVNSSTHQQKQLTAIHNVKTPMQHHVASTGAHNKYGLCWKTLAGDKKLCCTQFDPTGQRTIKESSFDAPIEPQWIAVHNLEGAALLVATGKCNSDKCNEFYIIKINASGQQSSPVKFDNLNAESPDYSDNPTMDIAEDHEKNVVCFNLVSLNNRHKDQSDGTTSKNLQYRRNCYNKDDLEKLN